MKKMSIWGVGPKIMFPGYLALFILTWSPWSINLKETLNIQWAYLYRVSLILVFIGIIMLFSATVTIKKAVGSNHLITSGLFSYIRNPIYASHIFFIMPGVCLLTNKAVTLISVLLTLVIFYMFIPEEEKMLEENFGKEYLDYKNRAGRLIPRFFS